MVTDEEEGEQTNVTQNQKEVQRQQQVLGQKWDTTADQRTVEVI